MYLIMTTIRRTIVILILLAIVFFIYRGISPSGADRLLTNIKHIPVRLWLLSGDLLSSPDISSGATNWSWIILTGSKISTGKVLTGKALVFSSTLSSGWIFALESLVIPVQNTTTTIEPMSTWWSLTIVQTSVVVKTSPVVKQTIVKQSPSSSRNLAQDIALLNNLFK